MIYREHWRAPFFLAAGLSALCVLGALTSFHPDKISPEADARVDWIGAMLVTSGLVLIVFVLGQAPTAGWKTPCMFRFLPLPNKVRILIYVRYNRLFGHRSDPYGHFRRLGASSGELRHCARYAEVVLDPTTPYEAINMVTGQGPDDRDTRNRIPKLGRLHRLDILGSSVSQFTMHNVKILTSCF